MKRLRAIILTMLGIRNGNIASGVEAGMRVLCRHGRPVTMKLFVSEGV